MKKIAGINEDEIRALQNGKSYQLIFDTSANEIYIANRGIVSTNQIHLIDVYKPTDLKQTKKDTHKFTMSIKNKLKDEVKLICHSTVAKRYGKKFADGIKPYTYKDNPYYKCASPMKLYIEKAVDIQHERMSRQIA